MPNPPPSPMPDEELPLAVRLHRTARELNALAQNLRSALVRRQTEEIWQILSEQESKVQKLEQYCRLWADLFDPEDEAIAEDRKRIRDELEALQENQRVNAGLSQRFLSSVRKAVGSLGKDRARAMQTYNAAGRVSERTASRVINVLG